MLPRLNHIELEKTRQLLKDVFQHSQKFETINYLNWLYNDSPSGRVIQNDTDQAEHRIAHYALVPQRWINNGKLVNIALSLNTAVSPNHRKFGRFVDLADNTFREARKAGVELILGVANQNSTHGFINRLGFKLLGPLDTRFLNFISTRTTRSTEKLQFSEASKFLKDINGSSPSKAGLSRLWDTEEFKWRTDCPSARYNFFSVDEALIVSTVTKYFGISISVILKVFKKFGSDQIDLQSIASGACRLQRTPVAIYSGINSQIRISGSQLPVKFRPSPLNLILKNLNYDDVKTPCNPAEFEFLDFDAY